MFYFPKKYYWKFLEKPSQLSLVCFSLNIFMRCLKLDAPSTPSDPKKIGSNFNEQKMFILENVFHILRFSAPERSSVDALMRKLLVVCFSHECDNDFYWVFCPLLNSSCILNNICFSSSSSTELVSMLMHKLQTSSSSLHFFFAGVQQNKDFISHKRHNFSWLWKTAKQQSKEEV